MRDWCPGLYYRAVKKSHFLLSVINELLFCPIAVLIALAYISTDIKVSAYTIKSRTYFEKLLHIYKTAEIYIAIDRIGEQ